MLPALDAPRLARRAQGAAPNGRVERGLEVVRDAAAVGHPCTTPPALRTTISRSGRRTASPTSRSGLVKPADVHSSAGSRGWPQAQVGAGAARASARAAARTAATARERERPRRASAATPCPGRASPAPGRARARPGASAGERAETRPGSDAEHDAAAGQARQRRRASPAAPRLRLRGALVPPRRAEQHQPDDLDEAEQRERRGRGQRRRAPSAAASAAPTPAPSATCSSACSVSHSEAKPLSGGSAGDRHRADQERPAGARHPAAAGRPGDRARASRRPARTPPRPRNSSPLNTRVVERRGAARPRARTTPTSRRRGRAARAGAQAEHDDRRRSRSVEREQPLELVLRTSA